MIAGVVGYALVVQLILAAVANGAALAHDLDGGWSVCSGSSALMPPDNGTDPTQPLALCCVVSALVAAQPPLSSAPRRRVVALRLAATVPAPLPTAVLVGHIGQARAPPVA